MYTCLYIILERERGREGSIFFPECVAKASRFTLGVWGLGRGRSTPLSHPQPLFVTVRNRSQPSAMRSLWPCLWEVLQKWSLLEVTNFSQRRFSGTLWRVHLHFAWLAQHFRLWCCMFFCESPCQGCVKWWQRATCVAGVGHCESVFLSGRCSIWWRSVVFAMWSCVSGAVFGTLYTLHSPLYTLHSTLDTLHLPLHTLHSALN